MNKYINLGDTIEGNSVSFEIRKWIFKGLKKHPITQKRMTLYTSDKNSNAEVITGREEPEDEELKQKTSHFHRNVGDTLQADALTIYVDNIRKIKPSVSEGATHRHGAQYTTTKDHTISHIKVPLANFNKILGFSNNEIEE